MLLPTISFLGADTSFEDAKFIIVGVPFDRTTTFRPGSRSAPNAIREASYNFESYIFEHDLDIKTCPIHDMGNLPEFESAQEMVEATRTIAKKIVSAGKFPIFLGGEHTISAPVIESFKDKDIGVISIDARLNYRDTYLGQKYSRACVTKRAVDQVGRENVLVFGVRSFSKEEKTAGNMPEYIDAYSIAEDGLDKSFKRALNIIKKEKIYLSIDIDGIDPAFAPGTSSCEPFGLSSFDVKKCINSLGSRMIGFDITEISPPYDKGCTSALGARLIQETIAVVSKYQNTSNGKEKGHSFSSSWSRR